MIIALTGGTLFTSSTGTLQMFISCRGIPVLVGFLEADYAKYRWYLLGHSEHIPFRSMFFSLLI